MQIHIQLGVKGIETKQGLNTIRIVMEKVRLKVEYSKSARAACPLCGNAIAKGVARIGRETFAGGHPQTRWHHPKCFGESYPEAELVKMTGFDLLKDEDKEALRVIGEGAENGNDATAKSTDATEEITDTKSTTVVRSEAATLDGGGVSTSSTVVTTKSKTVVRSEAAKSGASGGLASSNVVSCFRVTELTESYQGVPLPECWNAYSSLIYYEGADLKHQEKIAAFDFDGTLANTSVARPGADKWSLMYGSIPKKLASYHEEGYKLVIFTNEATIDKWMNKRAAAIASKVGRLKAFMETVKLPIQMFIACAKNNSGDAFRKPATGMWILLEEHLNGGIPIDKENSFYVGDAAGRKNDHSDADIEFAKTLGLKFLLPEQVFK